MSLLKTKNKKQKTKKEENKMKIKTIIRMEKIKNWGELKNKNAHNIREIKVVNADGTKNIKVLKGGVNIINTTKKLLLKKGIDTKKIRKDAVIMTELVLSLSPDFFEENELNFNGKFNKENTFFFIKTAFEHLKEKFEDNLVFCAVHLDEKTPHLHAFVCPLIKEDDEKHRLSCRDFFNRTALINLQEEYCSSFNNKKFKNYNFEYIEGSKAEHTTLKKYYSVANKTINTINQKDDEISNLKEKIDEKETELKKIKNKFIARETFFEETIKELKVKNDELKIENIKLKEILESLKQTFLNFASEKIKYIENKVIDFLNIKPKEKSENERIIEMLEKNQIEREIDDEYNDECDKEKRNKYVSKLQYKPKFKLNLK
ncbi:plasmid recombination protein [Shewanella xiamenensis]